MNNKKNTLLYTLGLSTSLLGSKIYGFALSFYILQLTGSALSFSISLIVSILPEIILSPIAGVITDRTNKKSLVVFFDLLNFILFLCMFMFGFRGENILMMLYVSLFLNSVFSTFFSNSMTAAIPNFFSSNRIIKINSIMSFLRSSVQIIAPVIGGVVVALVPIGIICAINSATYLFSACCELAMKYVSDSKSEERYPNNFIQDFKYGIRYVRKNKWIGILITNMAFINFSTAIIYIIFPYLVVTHFEQSSETFGLLEGYSAIGTIVATILVAKFANKIDEKKLLFRGVFLLGVAIVFIGIPIVIFNSWNYYIFFILGGLQFIIGGLLMIINIPMISLLQQCIEENVRGKVFGVVQSVVTMMVPLSYMINGYILDLFPSYYLVFILGVTIIVMSFRLKKIDVGVSCNI